MRRRPATASGIRPLRVMTLIDALEGGGAERFALALAARLRGRGVEVTLCASRAGPWDERVAWLAGQGVDCVLLGRRARLALLDWLPLARELRRRRIDVLHTHKFGSNVWGCLVGRLARTPAIVTTEHSWDFRGRPVRRLLDRLVVGRLASCCVAVSDHDRRRMIEVEGMPPEKIRVLPTGLVEDASRPADRPASDLRAEIGAPPDAPLVGSVSYLRPAKALEVLVAAHPQLRARVPAARLVIVGDGPERARLEALARGLGPSAGVHFLGQRADVAAIYPQLDVFVLCSDSEGSPLSLLEAMAAGRPIAATRVGGIPSIAPDGECALLVPPRDPAALAGAIARLLSDPALARRLGERARDRAANTFGLDAVAERWERLYRELRDAAPARRLRRPSRRGDRGG